MLTAPDILSTISRNHDVLRRFKVRRIGLFGSFARNEATDTSDIDFVVEFDEKTFDGYMDTKEFLEALFARPVDLVTHEAIKPRLRDAILGETVYAKGYGGAG